MADDADPPRQFYGFKPKTFVRENEVGQPALPPSVHPAEPASPAASPARIDVRDLHRDAAVPGPVLRRSAARLPKNEIHGILKDNTARETAAGLNELAPLPERKARRRSDYILVVISTVLVFGTLAAYGFRTGNAVLFIYSIAAIAVILSAATWVMWFVMDKY